jgi:ABC-type nickel/cobalt efflux system permease component RcnA
MLGLDDWIAGLSDSGSVLVVVLVATLLGLRHATDPDHVAAVTTLVASGRDRAVRSAARLGAWWGLGHAVTLVAFGLPILLAERYLPERAQQGAETAVAALIVFLAIRLLLRWRHGVFSTVPGGSGGDDHRHGVRTPLGAFGIGLVHGMGGSAGVGVLLLAAIPDPTVAIGALLVLALFTAVSMTLVTSGFGATLTIPSVARSVAGVAPALGIASLAFGVWYAAAAWSLAPYPF